MTNPMYKHNCQSCVFLGRFNIYDLYVHPGGMSEMQLFARHSSGRHMVIDGVADNFIGTSLQSQAIRTAYHEALLAGYDVLIPSKVRDHPDLFPGLSDNDIAGIVRDIQHSYDFTMNTVIDRIQKLIECTEKQACQFANEVYNGLTDPLAFKERLIQIRHQFLDEADDIAIKIYREEQRASDPDLATVIEKQKILLREKDVKIAKLEAKLEALRPVSILTQRLIELNKQLAETEVYLEANKHLKFLL